MIIKRGFGRRGFGGSISRRSAFDAVGAVCDILWLGALVSYLVCASVEKRTTRLSAFGLGLIAGLAWTAAGLYPEWTLVLLPVFVLAWIAAFGGLAVLDGRMLLCPRLD